MKTDTWKHIGTIARSLAGKLMAARDGIQRSPTPIDGDESGVARGQESNLPSEHGTYLCPLPNLGPTLEEKAAAVANDDSGRCPAGIKEPTGGKGGRQRGEKSPPACAAVSAGGARLGEDRSSTLDIGIAVTRNPPPGRVGVVPISPHDQGAAPFASHASLHVAAFELPSQVIGQACCCATSNRYATGSPRRAAATSG